MPTKTKKTTPSQSNSDMNRENGKQTNTSSKRGAMDSAKRESRSENLNKRNSSQKNAGQ